MTVAPVTLEGHGVRLEPIEERHREGLRAAADDPAVWEFTPVDGRGGPLRAWLDVWLDRAIASGDLVLAVRRLEDDALVGSTRFLNVEPAHRRLEIGGTWYGADARGTTVNAACKLILLTQAFEVLDALRVELKCDARNVRSRRAIARLGATEEGVLRRHMILGDGWVRDTVYFSVLEDEWPRVRAGLEARVRR